MPISSSDILNLSHALKDICEVDCETCPLLTNTLRLVAQSNLLQAHLLYSHTLSEACCQERILLQDPRQEKFNLNYIHEHPRADHDRNDYDDCGSDNCD